MEVLIIEDEQLAAENLAQMVKTIDPDIQIVDTLSTIRDSVKWLRAHRADLIFLDIRLSDGLSFEIFNQVEVAAPVVFTTAYNEYAVKVFEVNSIDFLLKPIKPAELQRALRKYKLMQEHFTQPDYSNLANILLKKQTPYKQRFSARVGQKIKVVNVPDIAFVHSAAGDTFIYTKGGSTLPLDESLEKLEGMLDPKVFFRVNRQFIVSIEAIAEMNILSNRSIKVNIKPLPPEACIVSVHRLKAFKDWLDASE